MSSLCDLTRGINAAFTQINNHFNTLFGFTNGETVLPPSAIPLNEGGERSQIIRITNPDDFQIRLTHEIDLSIRASNEPDKSAPITAIDVVHPSVLHFPTRWNGWEWWMCITPYPASDATYENPSMLVSHDGINWIEVPGAVNPAVAYPELTDSQGDCSLAYDPEGNCLVIAYLRTHPGGRDIRIVKSLDGITWSTPIVAIFYSSLILGSPSIVRYINSAGAVRWRIYFNRAVSGLELQFVESSNPLGTGELWSASAVTTCVVTGLGTGRVVWDFHMYNLPGGQWVYCPTICYGDLSAATRPVLGVSDDGTNFQCGKALLRRTQSGGLGHGSLVYTTCLVPSFGGDSIFRAFVSGLTVGVGWRLIAGDVVLRPKGVPSGAQKVFEFNHKYNITPASGAMVTVASATPEGVTAASVNNGATKGSRGTTGITFSDVDQYLNWATPQPWTACPKFTAICRFRPLGDPAVATGTRTIFIIRDLVVELRPIGGNWQIWILQLAGAFAFVPQLIIPYTELITIAVSWDGTVARFGSSLSHDYGGFPDSVPGTVAATGDIWIGGGTNTGAPGGILIDKLLIFDRSATENLEGLATSFDY